MPSTRKQNGMVDNTHSKFMPEHGKPFIIKPALQADADKIEAMVKTMNVAFDAALRMAQSGFQTGYEGLQTFQVGGLAFAIGNGTIPPKVYKICPGCMAGAAAGFREMAGTIEDTLKEAEKHK